MSAQPSATPAEDLARIRAALLAAAEALRALDARAIGVAYKAHGSPVTDADLAVDALLRRALPREDEGWLSEATADDQGRLARRRVWVVDPIDGTREFMEGPRPCRARVGPDVARGCDRAREPRGRPLSFNRWPPRTAGMLIATPGLVRPIRALLREIHRDGQ